MIYDGNCWFWRCSTMYHIRFNFLLPGGWFALHGCGMGRNVSLDGCPEGVTSPSSVPRRTKFGLSSALKLTRYGSLCLCVHLCVAYLFFLIRRRRRCRLLFSDWIIKSTSYFSALQQPSVVWQWTNSWCQISDRETVNKNYDGWRCWLDVVEGCILDRALCVVAWRRVRHLGFKVGLQDARKKQKTKWGNQCCMLFF